MAPDTACVPKYYSSWFEIDLDALRYNYQYIAAKVAPSKVIATIKANAIGHGARMVGRTLQAEGVHLLAVSNFLESMDLRKHGVTAGILAMNGLLPHQMEMAIEHDVSFFVFNADAARTANDLGRKAGKKARVHLKVDTGMGRLGILPDDAPALALALRGLDWLSIEGVASHLASPYVPEHDWFSVQQYELFVKAAQILDPEHRATWHFTASSGVLRFPQAYSDAVRFQGILYGLARVWPLPWPLKPVASYKARVIQVKTLPKGHNIGYGLHYTTNRTSRIAIVPTGTVDGLTFEHADTGLVLIRGKRCHIRGICACEMMVDVTGVDGVEPGDEVVLIGRQGEDYLSAPEFAALVNTNYTTILAKASWRVPRIYFSEGKRVGIEVFGEESN